MDLLYNYFYYRTLLNTWIKKYFQIVRYFIHESFMYLIFEFSSFDF